MKRHCSRRAFTLVEALATLAILSVAGGALMLGVHTALSETQFAEEQTISLGIAQQLMDEIVGKHYAAPGLGPYQTTLGPSPTETSGGRPTYDDIDDYNGYQASPPVAPKGVALGVEDGVGGSRHSAFQCTAGLLARLREQVEVYYVSDSNLSQRLASGQTSNYRAVEVKIYVIGPGAASREVARLRRVVAYVPTS